MTGIDLTRARARVADRLLVDTCTIRHDAQGTGDDVLDETTGALTPPTGDSTIVYSGLCAVTTPTMQPRTDDTGGQTGALQRKTVRLPWDAPTPVPGDTVTITASADPALTGRRFRIVDVAASTILVMRTLTVEDTVPLLG